MIKREELENPNSCMNRAYEDEMTFVLLGRDVTAPATIRFWAELRIGKMKNRANDVQILDAYATAKKMEEDFEKLNSRKNSVLTELHKLRLLSTEDLQNELRLSFGSLNPFERDCHILVYLCEKYGTGKVRDAVIAENGTKPMLRLEPSDKYLDPYTSPISRNQRCKASHGLGTECAKPNGHDGPHLNGKEVW